MNLRKVYPYIPAKLNDALMAFSMGAQVWYDRIGQVASDVAECAALLRPREG